VALRPLTIKPTASRKGHVADLAAVLQHIGHRAVFIEAEQAAIQHV